MAEDTLRYDRMVQDAMRSVVRRALTEVSESGLPGDHHFYLTFRTDHPGVDIPGHLRATYPQDMTIVLQHQFYGLEVHEAHFEVTLSFRKRLERLKVPFAAIVAFVDPAVNFGLQFQPEGVEPGQQEVPADAAARPAAEAGPASEAETSGDDAVEKVVSLDAFRKK